MRTIERGAVYDDNDNTICFRCDTCGEIFPSMFGDARGACRGKEMRHKELVNAILKINGKDVVLDNK